MKKIVFSNKKQKLLRALVTLKMKTASSDYFPISMQQGTES